MAEKLKTYDFARTRTPRYPWDEWCDGSIWRVVHGEDFTSKPSSFRSILSSTATARGMKVRSKLEDDTTVVFQFVEK